MVGTSKPAPALYLLQEVACVAALGDVAGVAGEELAVGAGNAGSPVGWAEVRYGPGSVNSAR
jgi:hypothetical protein